MFGNAVFFVTRIRTANTEQQLGSIFAPTHINILTLPNWLKRALPLLMSKAAEEYTATVQLCQPTNQRRVSEGFSRYSIMIISIIFTITKVVRTYVRTRGKNDRKSSRSDLRASDVYGGDVGVNIGSELLLPVLPFSPPVISEQKNKSRIFRTETNIRENSGCLGEKK